MVSEKRLSTMATCKIDNFECKSTSGLVRHLRKVGIDPKKYYDEYERKEGEGICPTCGKETPFVKFAYRTYCDISCSVDDISRRCTGIKKTLSDEDLKKKSKLHSKSSYTPEEWKKRQKRCKASFIERYGVSREEFLRQSTTNYYDSLTPEEKLQRDMLALIAQDKSPNKSKKYKEYDLFGEIVNVQGYEPFVLDVLKKLYNKGEIVVGRHKDKIIRYVENGKTRSYFPDIFLPENVIIEVKSRYTLLNNLENTMLKMKAALNSGYKPLLVIWEPKSQDSIEQCENDLIETISSQVWRYPERLNDYPFIGVGHKPTVSEVLEALRGL